MVVSKSNTKIKNTLTPNTVSKGTATSKNFKKLKEIITIIIILTIIIIEIYKRIGNWRSLSMGMRS